MKKICFVTAARSEYGLLKWLMRGIQEEEELQLQLVVIGAHLLLEQGHTVDQIIEDGFVIDYIVDAQLDISTMVSIAASMGRMAEKLAPVFEKLNPDYLVVLGDRYELLPICNTAFVMRIPIIHLSGGDVTKGAIDNGVRNAITMLASYHFPGTYESADNICRMKGSNDCIWAVGEPGLDAFNREKLLSRKELAENLQLRIDSKWILLTYHAETMESLEYNLNAIKACVRAITELSGFQAVVTYSNADYGGQFINNYLEMITESKTKEFIVIPSLGNLRYLSLMKQVVFVAGNSSSGIIEAPMLKIPVVNIGKRQKGRYLCGNIIQCDAEYNSIKNAIQKAILQKIDVNDIDYWGDGHTSERIINILKKNIV